MFSSCHAIVNSKTRGHNHVYKQDMLQYLDRKLSPQKLTFFVQNVMIPAKSSVSVQRLKVVHLMKQNIHQ